MNAELSSPETAPNKHASPALTGSSSSSSSSSSASPSSLAFSNTVSNPPDQNGGSGDGDVEVDVAVSENEEEGFASGAEDFEPASAAKEISDEVSGGEYIGGDFFPTSPEFSKVGEKRPIAKLSVDEDDEEFDFAGSEVRVSEGDMETENVVDESLVNEKNGGAEELGTEELKKDEGFDGKHSGDLSEVDVEEEKIGEEESVVVEVKVEVLDSSTAIVGDVEGIKVSEIKAVEAAEVKNDFNTLESIDSKSLALNSDFTENVAEESRDVKVVVDKEVSGASSDELASKEASSEDVPKTVPVVEAVVEKEASSADSNEVVPKNLPESEDGVQADSEGEEKKKEESEVVALNADEVPTAASLINGVSELLEDSKLSDNGTHDESDGSGEPLVPKPTEPESTPSREIVLEDEDDDGEDGEDDREITGGSDSDEIVYGNAAKNFYKQLERKSAGGREDISREIDGQIVTDSDEEVDTEEEDDDDDEEGGKEMFDSAALAALLKAATGASSDGGGNVTITSPDGSRLFSVKRPAGLGMGSSLPKFAARPNHSSLFAPPSPVAGGAPEEKLTDEEKKKLDKFHQVRVKYLRLVNRLGISIEESISRQVLYRLALVAGRVSSREYSVESAKETALKLETESKDDLDFSLNLLVIGKSGVGKSSTINSIFGEQKSSIHAFGRSTTSVKEIVGMVDGVKIRVFDSPGLESAAADQSYNRRILAKVKSVTKKCPPDIVLYVDRLDTQSRDLNDLPLLRSITSALGPAIWRSGIVTLTHAASSPPDGPTGAPLNYELFVGQRSQILQQSIGQAVGDLRAMSPSLMNPISLVENHPSCRKNRDGQKVLPNGQAWRSQLLHLCYSMKILSEASGLSKPQEAVDQRKLFGFRVRSPPLPYILSWLLQSRTHPKLAGDQGGDNGDSDIDLDDFSDGEQEEEEDEFDQLPPFKPLRRTQIVKLSNDQKRAYLEEYDYRVKLLQKKQWREELRRMKEMKKGGRNKLGSATAGDQYDGEEDPENGAPAAVPVASPDMILPLSFDGVSPAYRYRFLEPTSQFLARPVLDPHGWDHDCGYDGVNIEHSLAIASQFPGAISVQITKDKKEFNLHLDSSVAAKHGETGSTMAGFDIQNIGKQLAYIVRGETKMKSFKRNKSAAGVSVTFLGENVSTGVKIEDQLSVGKRVVLVGKAGVVKCQSDTAYGANLEVRLREADFPIGQDQSTLGLSLVKWRGDLALGANFQSQLSLGRSYKMAVRAGINQKLSGQISVRTSSSEQLQIAFIALLPIVRSIVKALWPGAATEGYSVY